MNPACLHNRALFKSSVGSKTSPFLTSRTCRFFHFVTSASRMFTRYPVTRGMLTYSILWPSSNAIQQQFDKKPYNYKETIRYTVFACFYVAPVFYGWIRISGFLFPTQTVTTAVGKAVLEQFTYWPFAITSFYTGMNLLQGTFDYKLIRREWDEKFYKTWRAGMCFWPIVQTLNYSLIPVRNRVPVASAASFAWVLFLSFMKKQKFRGYEMDHYESLIDKWDV